MRHKLLALYMRYVMRATWWHYFTVDEMSDDEAQEFAERFYFAPIELAVLKRQEEQK